MVDWLLETIEEVGAIGFDSPWQSSDLRHAPVGGEPVRKPRGLSPRRLKAVLG